MILRRTTLHGSRAKKWCGFFYTGLKDFAGPLILLVICFTMLFVSWQKWPDILIDFGRELYVPWQLSIGNVLYRDIAYFNGPFSPYFNSSLFKIFGTGLITIAIFNICLVIIFAYSIYRFFIIVTDRVVATAASAVFLAIFAFSRTNYNFVCPYSHEMTHGVFLSFLSIYLFSIYLNRRTNKLLAVIGVLMGLIFLTKIEIFLAAFTAVLCGTLFLIFAYRFAVKEIVKLFGTFFLGFFLPIVVFAAYLSRYMNLFEALSSFGIPYRAILKTSVVSGAFYRLITGLDAPLENFIVMLLAGGAYITILFSFGLIGYLLDRVDNIRPVIFRVFILSLIFCLLTLCLCWLITYIPAQQIYKALPLAMVALGVYIFISLFRSRNDYQKVNKLLPIFVMTTFSFFLLFKIILNTTVSYYGFALAIPATLLLVMIFLYQVPLLLRRIFKKCVLIRTMVLLLIGIVLVFDIIFVKQRYDLAKFAVGSGRDIILTVNTQTMGKGECIRLALDKIEKNIKKNETFVVLPEGVMLNYLSRRKNPCGYINFMPVELEIFGEDVILTSLVKSRPDYVILVERAMSEYGCKYFGRDYGVRIFAWVKKNYRPVSVIGEEPLSNKGFGIVISKRITTS